jgi:protein TonB
LTTSCSVVVHSVGLVATLALPLLLSSGLPEPAGAVHAFLVDPLVPPPPPPPPPAPAPRSAVDRPTPAALPAQPEGFIAPVEVPSELKPEDELDLGIEDGVAGGVEGGVPGGVVGAIVGGLPEAPAKPPPPGPLRVSGLVKEPVKIKHVAPVYPPAAVAGKIEGSVGLEALIDVRGRVAEVHVLQGNPLFEEAALEAARQWVYTPTLLDGVPVPLILMVTVHFQLAD